jgi:hypothetical protein
VRPDKRCGRYLRIGSELPIGDACRHHRVPQFHLGHSVIAGSVNLLSPWEIDPFNIRNTDCGMNQPANHFREQSLRLVGVSPAVELQSLDPLVVSHAVGYGVNSTGSWLCNGDIAMKGMVFESRVERLRESHYRSRDHSKKSVTGIKKL